MPLTNFTVLYYVYSILVLPVNVEKKNFNFKI